MSVTYFTNFANNSFLDCVLHSSTHVEGLSSVSAAECKERWKNLRAVFVRNMKPASSGSGSKNKRPYYLAVSYIKALSTATGNPPNVPMW